MDLIFPLLVAFCRLSSLLLVGLTSRSWMCWMKTAGDWPSEILASFIAYSLAPSSGLWCLSFLFAPSSLSKMQWFKQFALLCFNLKLLSKIHISQDSVSFSSVRESIYLITTHRKNNNFSKGFVDLFLVLESILAMLGILLD